MLEPNQDIKLAVDIILFTIHDKKLQVLLVRRKYDPFKGAYVIPGGFVLNDESLHDAALRELKEETNVPKVFLLQLGAYGEVNRDPRDRIVSIAYLGFVDSTKYEIQADTDASHVEWRAIDDIPELGFDHKDILSDALVRLRLEVQTTNIASQILPKLFTLSQLQATYESVLDHGFDKRNFRKKIESLDVIEKTDEVFQEGPGRPAALYRFKSRDYQPLSETVRITT